MEEKLDTKRDEEITPIRKCAHCGIDMPEQNTKFKTRKFCTVRCNRRYFSLQRYHKIKSTDKYKDYRRDYYKVWLSKNRDKFNASMRKASLKYQAKKKVEREEKKKEKLAIKNKGKDEKRENVASGDTDNRKEVKI